jgi:hypothetical protein
MRQKHSHPEQESKMEDQIVLSERELKAMEEGNRYRTRPPARRRLCLWKFASTNTEPRSVNGYAAPIFIFAAREYNVGNPT